MDFDFDLNDVPLLGVGNLPDTRLGYGNPTIQAAGIQTSGTLLTVYPSEPLACPTGEETLGFNLTVLNTDYTLGFVSNTGNVITFSVATIVSATLDVLLEYTLNNGSWVSERTGYPLSDYSGNIGNGSLQDVPQFLSGNVAADGITITLTFSTNIVFTGSQTLGVTIMADASPVTLSFVSVAANVVTYQASTPIQIGQTTTFAYSGGTIESSGGIALPAVATTPIANNSTVDLTAAFVSGAIAADGLTVTIVLDNNIAIPSGDKATGFTCITYGYTQALTYVSYATDTPIVGQSTITFTVPGKARVGDACTIAYSGGNWLIDTLSATSLTNNSAVAAFSTQASNVFSTMPTSSALAPVLRDKMAAFVDSQQAVGNWAKINEFQCYYVAGDLMTDQSNALAGWKGTDATLAGTATWDATTGAEFSAAGDYVDTNIAPVSQNSQAFGMKFGTITSLGAAGVYLFGLRNGATTTKLVRPRIDGSGQVDSYSINGGPDAVATLTALANDDTVMIIRTGAAAHEYRLNNVSKDTGTVASDVITGTPDIHINGYNNGGTHTNGGGTWNCKAFVSLDPAGFDFATFQTDLVTLCN